MGALEVVRKPCNFNPNLSREDLTPNLLVEHFGLEHQTQCLVVLSFCLKCQGASVKHVGLHSAKAVGFAQVAHLIAEFERLIAAPLTNPHDGQVGERGNDLVRVLQRSSRFEGSAGVSVGEFQREWRSPIEVHQAEDAVTLDQGVESV